MAETVLEGVKKASGWSIVLGVLMILAGILAIFSPLAAGVVAVYIVAWAAIFNGVMQLFFGFRAHTGGRMLLEVLLGLLYIAAGFYIFWHPVPGLLAFTAIIASFLLIYGVFALVLAFQLRPHKGWGWVLFDAILTIFLGCLIWAHWPGESLWLVGTLLGISFISSGVTRLMLSVAVRKVASQVA